MTERLILPDKPTGNTPGAAEALKMLRRVGAEYDGWRDLLRNANQAKRELVATIFEESLRYEKDPEAKAALIGEVNRLPEVQPHKRWQASSELDSADIILTTVLGIGETKATKSQWLKAIIKGRKFAEDRDGFLQWLDIKGGIIGAGTDEPSGDDDGGGEPILSAPSAIDRLLKALPAMSQAASTIPLKVNPDHEAHKKLFAALLTPATDEGGAPTGDALILKESNDEKLLELFAKLALPKRRARSPKEIGRLVIKLLTRLNNITIKTATPPRGRMKASACITFIRATRILGELDGGGIYFTGTPYFPLTKIWDGKKDRGELTVVNPDFHPLDPGRYIGNAKQGALLAYEVPGPTVAECRDQIGEFVHATCKIRPEASHPDASLERFLAAEGLAEQPDGADVAAELGKEQEQERSRFAVLGPDIKAADSGVGAPASEDAQ
jgi:hypothetical protein